MGKFFYDNEKFIAKAREIHGDRYLYDKVDYQGSKEKIIVMCRIHGDFLINPNRHLSSKQGCRACGIIKASRGKKIFAEDYKKLLIEKNGDFWDYVFPHEGRCKADVPIKVICPIHGVSWKEPCYINQGKVCTACGNARKNDHKRLTDQDWVERFREFHGDRYIYDNLQYVNSSVKVNITCRIHGDFQVLPFEHIRKEGTGCPECSKIRRLRMYKERGGWVSENWFKRHPEKCDIPTVVYLFRIKTEADEFIKVGISWEHSHVRRASSVKTESKAVEFEFIDKAELGFFDAWKAEKEILEKYKSFKHHPEISFAGETECLSLNVLDKVKEDIENLK